jgi:hypothetical protein
MDVKKIIETGAINMSWLANELWPGNKSSKTKMSKKVNNQDGQRLTERDYEAIEDVFTKLLEK